MTHHPLRDRKKQRGRQTERTCLVRCASDGLFLSASVYFGPFAIALSVVNVQRVFHDPISFRSAYKDAQNKESWNILESATCCSLVASSASLAIASSII